MAIAYAKGKGYVRLARLPSSAGTGGHQRVGTERVECVEYCRIVGSFFFVLRVDLR